MLYEIGDLLKFRNTIKATFQKPALVLGYGEYSDDKIVYTYYKLFHLSDETVVELSTMATENLYERA
jgi:hypothetical protein